MNIFDLIYSDTAYLLLFVTALVVVKYGVVGFVLSKTVKSSLWKESIDALVTAAMLVGLFVLNRNRPVETTNGNVLLNVVYTLMAIVLYYAVNVALGETLGGGKNRQPTAHRTAYPQGALCTVAACHRCAGSGV